MKIASLELENVKKIKAVELQPSPDGLTIIGGKNGQGKTSILDAIAWALGGSKREPSTAKRDGSLTDPYIHIVLDNGLIVERKGKNSALTVTDPEGQKAGQKLLDSFINEFALDLPKFMQASDRDKAKILLQLIGVGDKLADLERKEKALYDKRQAYYPLMTAKVAHANEMPEYVDAPAEKISAADLIAKQQKIIQQNNRNEQVRINLGSMKSKLSMDTLQYEQLCAKQHELTLMIDKLLKSIEEQKDSIRIAEDEVANLVDDNTAEIAEQLEELEDLNRKVQANLDKQRMKDEATEMSLQYQNMSKEIDDVRKEKLELLNGANLPLAGLGIKDGCLTYNDMKWDCMSGAEQMIVGTAIVRGLKPDCKFVLMDKLEQMDIDQLTTFDAWLRKKGLQVIATRVSTGEECQIIIEDGMVKDAAIETHAAKAKEDFPW